MESVELKEKFIQMKQTTALVSLFAKMLELIDEPMYLWPAMHKQ